MCWWKQVFLAPLFRRPLAPRSSPARETSWGNRAQQFRPSVLVLEDRTVPSGSDLFETAMVLSGNSITVTGSNVGATGEAGEPNHAGNAADFDGNLNSVWWQWTATSSGLVEINTFGSDFDTVLAVYTGDAVDNLTEMASNDEADARGHSQVIFEAVAGTTYYVAVDGAADTTGEVVLKLGTAVSNDNFTNAVASDGSTVTGSNVGATGETGEPEHAGSGNPTSSVWWVWTAPSDAFVVLDTVGSDFDTAIAVYTGDTVDNLTLVAENNDIAPASQFPDNPELQSRVGFEAIGGTTYFIAVDGFQNLTGNIVLNSSVVPTNNPPQFEDQAFEVDENSAVSAVVGTVMASDPDVGQTLTYAITGGSGSEAFAIDAATGEITVADAAALNYEATPSFLLFVTVADSGTPTLSVSAIVTVNLNDVNEAPEFGPIAPFDLDENSAAGTVVGAVEASDPDAGETLTYAITGGDPTGAFAIDAATGAVIVADPTALNYEATPSFLLTVTVTDSGTLSATTTVTVTLRDVNDAPVLDNSGTMSLAAIDQGDANNPGTLVSAILASAGGNRVTDEDAGALSGIAVVAADTAHGIWQFSTNGGATWSALGAVSDSSARLLAADAGTRVRFVPAAGFSGTVERGISFRAWDRTSGQNGGLADASVNGGSSAFSAASETAGIQVRAVANGFQLLEAEVESLVEGGVLSPVQGLILEIPLHLAKRKLDEGHSQSAVQFLQLFTGFVDLYVHLGLLTAAQGGSLITQANALIASIKP